ncbi:MAG: GAF domain-containing protein [Myxococcota bacterium]
MTGQDVQSWLEGFIAAHGGVAGTVHTLSPEDPDLLLIGASVNIPPKVVEITGRIPRGKGMAGLAFERDAPVQTCNLQTDGSGDVRPGAKAVQAQAAVALPVRGADGKVAAVVGIAFGDERELTDAQLSELTDAADACPR